MHWLNLTEILREKLYKKYDAGLKCVILNGELENGSHSFFKNF